MWRLQPPQQWRYKECGHIRENRECPEEEVGVNKRKKGVWLLRRKIGFSEEKQWMSEVESESRVSGLSLKLQESKETK